jgi:hypothetical protein
VSFEDAFAYASIYIVKKEAFLFCKKKTIGTKLKEVRYIIAADPEGKGALKGCCVPDFEFTVAGVVLARGYKTIVGEGMDRKGSRFMGYEALCASACGNIPKFKDACVVGADNGNAIIGKDSEIAGMKGKRNALCGIKEGLRCCVKDKKVRQGASVGIPVGIVVGFPYSEKDLVVGQRAGKKGGKTERGELDAGCYFVWIGAARELVPVRFNFFCKLTTSSLANIQ